MNADEELHELAARQHGFVTRFAMRALGLTRKAMRHRIAQGD